jgi:citrate lyase subunit beta/citryl-CoA lyase
MNSQRLRPRRSVLYMPGSNARALAKARELPVDCVIMDLEDAVSPDAKIAAREQVIEIVNAGNFGHREVVVRINALDTEWGLEDLEQVIASAANAVLLPKIESAEPIEATRGLLSRAGAGDLSIWIMAETPRGILNLDEIIRRQPHVEVVVLGTSDLAKELRLPASTGRSGLLPALGSAVLAARANGLDIIDGVHLALDDAEGFEAACRQGRELGFDGKSLIHPGQIAAANEIFGISESAAEHAREIESAWRDASAAGQGVAVVRGRLVERLHVDEARRVLTLYSQMNARDEQE